MQTALSFGTTVLGGFLGRKVLSSGNLGRAKSTISGVSRSRKEAQDVKRAADTVESLRSRLEQLEADFKLDTAALESKMDPLTEQLEQISVRPTKTGISVKLLALGWLPYWRGDDDKLTPAW